MPALTRLNAWMVENSSGPRVLLILAAFLLMFVVFGTVLTPAFQAASGGLMPIDMSPDKSVDTIYAQFSHYTARSRIIYRWFVLLDFIYPPTLAALFASVWHWLSRRTAWRFPARWLANGLFIVPFAAAALDWLENIGFLTLIEAWPVEHRGIALAAGLTNYTKLGLLAICMLVTLLFVLAALAGRRTPQAVS